MIRQNVPTRAQLSYTKQPGNPAQKRLVFGTLLFLLLTLNADALIFIAMSPLDHNNPTHYLFLLLKAPAFVIFLALLFFLAIFNVGFNLVMIGKNGSIKILHYFLIGVTIAFMFFVVSMRGKKDFGCSSPKLAVSCWIESIFS
jgi:hypothetical protein